MMAAVLLYTALLAFATDVAAPTPVAPQASPTSEPAQKLKGKMPREKETEGTEALNRFETDTIIKSRYHLNGQPLEVDPD